jgi:prevent-host-death family protein
MARVPASDFARNFGEWHDRAMREPVVITKHGRETAILIAAETFRMLLDRFREVVPAGDLDAAVTDAIKHGQIPEEYHSDSTDEDIPEARRGMSRG